jgi:hypothetical protein
MKVSEVVSPTKQVLNVQPSIVKQQRRVGQVVQQIAASDQQQAPTEMDKVLAMRRMSAMQKQADRNYARQLKRQAMLAVQAQSKNGHQK